MNEQIVFTAEAAENGTVNIKGAWNHFAFKCSSMVRMEVGLYYLLFKKKKREEFYDSPQIVKFVFLEGFVLNFYFHYPLSSPVWNSIIAVSSPHW